MIKFMMHGCNGKMGRMITEIVKGEENVTIAAGVDSYTEVPNEYPVFDSVEKCDVDVDVVIDFSTAGAVDALLDYCVEKKLPVVLCTTGLSEEQLKKVEEASKKTAVLKSANMSLGINLLLKLLKDAAKVLAPAGYDIEIVERHHNQKLDAPSGTALALAIALYSVIRQKSWGQRWVEILNTWSISMPTFCAGVIFILIFSIWLGWLPVLGSFILPVVIMALDNGGQIVKPLSEELKESASLPHIRTARAKGLSPLRIAIYHILPNTTGILLSLSGLVLGSLVAGTLTMEILFGLPGLGSLTLNAIHGRDTPVVLACVAFIAVSLVLINTAVDILRQMADPRTAS